MANLNFISEKNLSKRIVQLLATQDRLTTQFSELDGSIQNKKRAYLIHEIPKHIVWLVKKYQSNNFLSHRFAIEFKIDRQLVRDGVSRKYTIFNS